MPRFCHKPVHVDAIRFIQRAALQRTHGEGVDLDTGVSFVNQRPLLLTRNGLVPVVDGDWIVIYSDGNQEVWRPSTFTAMWQEVK